METSLDDPLEFDCPLCGRAFEVQRQWLGYEVDCPHCGEAVRLAGSAADEVPASEPSEEEPREEESPNPFVGMASPPPAQKPKPKPKPKPEPIGPLSPNEREALRRRVNLVLAISAAVILVLTFLVLSWLVG